MCGFVGIIAPHAPPSHEDMVGFGATLRHRGPDDAGVYRDPEVGFGLAHRRLAILDLSPLGHQPMVSVSGRYVIAYNGEIYNHQSIRDTLRLHASDIVFRGGSDTETLLVAIECWGIERTLENLNGMFAFALWDRRERRLCLARDRMGEKPLYVGWIDGVLTFASELKPILSSFSTETDDEAMGLMLGLGYVPGPRSIVRGVFKLPPAHYLWIKASDANRSMNINEFRSVLRCYWDVGGRASSVRSGDSQAQLTERLEHLLKDAVRSRTLADVPLGACLSGGIDSSLIVALMQEQSMRPVKTYTVGFEEAAYDESRYAKSIADHLGTEHTNITLPASDALALVPELPQVYDEPFADSSQLPTLLLSRALRRHVTVALSGDGGDELFYGYARYRLTRRLWRLYGGLPSSLRRYVANQTAKFADRNFRLWRWPFGMGCRLCRHRSLELIPA